jgi:hypothetical protein
MHDAAATLMAEIGNVITPKVLVFDNSSFVQSSTHITTFCDDSTNSLPLVTPHPINHTFFGGTGGSPPFHSYDTWPV